MFHPDRYYGKNTGPFGPWLAEIFEMINKAFDVLSDDKMRQEYLVAIEGGATPARVGAQTQAEYASDLFARACHNENQGNLPVALKLYAAAVRLEPRSSYFARAARCALSAKRLPQAEQYARKAAELDGNDPTVLRVLSDTYRTFGKLRQAEKTLVSALALETENSALRSELQKDLAAVRAELAAAE